MMGYAFVLGACIVCKQPFTFHPHLVPSVVINGVREPICESCVRAANPLRRARGLPEIEIHPRAYDVAEESEL
jgi:hypothetical protein